MKKYLGQIVISMIFISASCYGNTQTDHTPTKNGDSYKQILQDVVTVLTEKPYLYEVKPQVAISYEGTTYAFNPTNATQPIPEDSDGNKPIHYAAKAGDVGDIKTLISWGADIMSKNNFDETPLIKAVEGGNFRAIYYLLANGAEITKSHRPFQDFNPFHYAVLLPKQAEAGTPTVIRVLQALLQQDSKRTHLNESSRIGTPLEVALKEELDPHIIKFLIMQGARVTNDALKLLEKKIYSPILEALQQGTLRSQMYTVF